MLKIKNALKTDHTNIYVYLNTLTWFTFDFNKFKKKYFFFEIMDLTVQQMNPA